jgi:D-3-phosphoglycerate dehydrogenase / 2-oxoglutarate reductase
LIGLLQSAVGRGVNFVNAQEVAKERGVEVKITTRSPSDFANEISIAARTRGGERRASGSVLSEGGPRITRIGRFSLEAVPEGSMLLVRNEDRPGVIGRIGTLLGDRGINISRLQVALDPASKEALALWNIDSAVTPADLDEIRKAPAILSATQVKL